MCEHMCFGNSSTYVCHVLCVYVGCVNMRVVCVWHVVICVVCVWHVAICVVYGQLCVVDVRVVSVRSMGAWLCVGVMWCSRRY